MTKTSDSTFGVQVCIVELGVQDNDNAQLPVLRTHAIPLASILSNGLEASLQQKKEESLGILSTKLKWIHLPVNNMSWVQDLIRTVCEETDRSTLNERFFRPEIWNDYQHQSSKVCQIAGSHMIPFCTEVSTDSPGGGSIGYSSSPLVLYMPFLHWDYFKSQIARMSILRGSPRDSHATTAKVPKAEVGCDMDPIEEKIMAQYLQGEVPLHPRRSLHQFGYETLHWDAISLKDASQVPIRYANVKNLDPKLLMVDQLWLWRIGNDMVISSFPGRTIPTKANPDLDPSEIWTQVIATLRERLADPTSVKTLTRGDAVPMLVRCIIERTTGSFFSNDLVPELRFFAMYDDMISRMEYARMECFDSFEREAPKLVEEHDTATFVGSISSINISQEIHLAAQIQGILEELKIISRVFQMQSDVVRTLSEILSVDMKPVHLERTRGDVKAIPWDIRDMQHDASSAYEGLQKLMDLKQKQANIIEARMARHEARQSVAQGNSIAIFTFTSGVFLPLSFFASVFGMNAKELNGGALGIRVILAITITASAAIIFIIVSIVLYCSSRTIRERRSKSKSNSDGKQSISKV